MDRRMALQLHPHHHNMTLQLHPHHHNMTLQLHQHRQTLLNLLILIGSDRHAFLRHVMGVKAKWVNFLLNPHQEAR